MLTMDDFLSMCGDGDLDSSLRVRVCDTCTTRDCEGCKYKKKEKGKDESEGMVLRQG